MNAREGIHSLQNPRIKQLVRLRERKERRRTGLTRVDGGRELLRALDAGLVPQCLYVCSPRLRHEEAVLARRRCAAAGVEEQEIGEAVYDKIRYGDRDEGICAVLAWSAGGLDELDRKLADRPAPWILVVEGVEKPGNLGAILRTADGAGVDAVVLADPVCEAASPNTIRASMGTLFTQTVVETAGDRLRAWLDQHGLRTVITRPQASALYTEVDLRGGLALVVGAEHRGLRPQWDREGSIAVRLPMHGRADSLNLSAASAILLYEALRQRSTR